MFSLIRGIIIVGLIFYFSPERDISEPEWQRRGERAPDATAPPALVEDGNTQDGLWNRIVGSLAEEAVRTTVNGKAQEAGLRLKEAAWSPRVSPKPGSPEVERATPDQSVRCVYRCDATE